MLSFALFSDNTDFYPLSFLPFDPPGQFVYCFDNLDGAVERTRSLSDTVDITEQLKLAMISGSISVPGYSEEPPKLLDANHDEVALHTR